MVNIMSPDKEVGYPSEKKKGSGLLKKAVSAMTGGIMPTGSGPFSPSEVNAGYKRLEEIKQPADYDIKHYGESVVMGETPKNSPSGRAIEQPSKETKSKGNEIQRI